MLDNKINRLKELLKESSAEGYLQCSEEKTSILVNVLPPLKKVTKQDFYPLTSSQKRLFILNELAHDKTVYNIPIAIRIVGNLDVKKLQKAFSIIIERHDALRTTFKMINDNPMQIIHEQIEWKLDHVVSHDFDFTNDLTNWVKPFDLKKDHLFRAQLIELPNSNYYLLIDMHHIISDARSFSVFIEEFSLIYSDKSLEPLSINYKDYAIWQNELLNSEYLLEQKEYWLKLFSQIPPLLQIPYDYPKSNIPSSPGERFFFEWDKVITSSLRALAKEMKVSLYMIIMSVYSILLYRYTNQEEIIIGSSIEGRSSPELRKLMGIFINTLPIKCENAPSKTFKELLHEVKKTCLFGYQNQLFPFEELANSIAPQRQFNTNPIFQTFFDFHKSNRGSVSIKDLVIEQMTVQQSTTKFDISLEAVEHENHLGLFFEYNTNLYAKDTIQRLVNSLTNIVQEVSKNPGLRIGEISIFNSQTQTQIHALFNPLDETIPYEVSFQKLFKNQVNHSPHRIAAQDDRIQITYSELDIMTDHLSRQLRKEGVQPGDIVATCMDRSVNLLICMLAIFKAGAVYLPIDPEYPLQRANEILKNSYAQLLITDNDGLKSNLYLISPVNINTLLSAPSFPLPELDIPTKMIAYIIFTSGSTGQPKGAMLSHSGMINHIYSKIRDLKLSNDDVIAQTSSQTFDVSIWQFLTILLVGGRVVIFNTRNAWSPSFLLKELVKNKISIFETVPSHMHLVLDELENQKPDLSHLRFLILNGESLSAKVCRKWHIHYPFIPIVNAYGPTECSDDICHYFVKKDDFLQKEIVPIGFMISNLKAAVLNESLSLMPPNVPGEFYIGGIGVGSGYIGRPDLTAEIFIPSPFGRNGERLYRTKDLTQYFLNGCVEYLGRVDRQVKIQGVRIELEEIENVLKEHPSIQQAAVLLKKDSALNEYLVAYVISEKNEHNEETLISELRSYLKPKLPSAMIPNFFMFLQDFPLNLSGKVNLKALPEPNKPAILIQETDIPETDTEKQLAVLWQNLLKITHIGKNDHFFERGGNSLLAIQLAAQIRQHFGIEIQLHEIFSNPLLKDFALCIHDLQNKHSNEKQIDHALPDVINDNASRYQPFPLTNVQHAYWLGRSGIFELGEVSVHIYTEYEKFDLNLDLLEKALNKLIIRHEALRLILPGDGKQRILREVPYYSIKRTNLIESTEKEIEKWMASKRLSLSHEIFPSDSWPLFSVEALLLPQNKIRLYLSFDALILDGWSVNNLVLEWKQYYDRIEDTLAPLELSFRDYVLTLNKIKDTQIYQRDKEYWLSRMEDFPLAPSLPILTTTQNHKQQFSRCTSKIPKHLWDECQNHLKRKGLSPTAFIAAVFCEILATFSGSDHFALNLTLFDRIPLHPQINDIAGDFTSIVLLEVNRKGLLLDSFVKRIEALQKQLWQDLDHHLYSGIEFLRELSKHYKDLPMGSLMPVVLTSILGVKENGSDIEQFLGKEVFGISQTPQVWLDYKAYETNGDLVIEWDFVKHLFPDNFVEKMHDSYVSLLEKLMLKTSLWNENAFDLIPAQQQKIRDRHNFINDSSFTPGLIHEPFFSIANKYSSQTAIIQGEREISYKELAKSTAQLAHALVAKDVQPNQLVAVVMEKGWEQILACLGITASGAAYLPINPEFPENRINQLLEIGDAKIILTQEKYFDSISRLPYAQQLGIKNTISISSLTDFDCFAETLPIVQTNSHDLAYVIFTSGSTGEPKGVMLEHGAVLNTIQDINERFEISSLDKILAISNLNFDLSVYDIFGLLSVGGTIVIPFAEKEKDPVHFLELIEKHKVTIWNTVPAFMQMLVEILQREPIKNQGKIKNTLRIVMLSGDWIPLNLPDAINHFFNSPSRVVRIISLGGATEASIWSIFYEVKLIDANYKSIPYGLPLRNQQWYILDDQYQDLPDWVAGQLYIGGLGLARGYWKDKEKTDASFIDIPQKGRLYKTGDYGRFHPDGTIEFLGRIDQQVKISGHRIECGEIEAHLKTHPDIEQSIVLFKKEPHPQLNAYIIPKKDHLEMENEIAILESSKRMEFKLAQKNIRDSTEINHSFALSNVFACSNESYFKRKSYRNFQSTPILGETFISTLEQAINCEWSYVNARNVTKLEQKDHSGGQSFSSKNISQLLSPLRGIYISKQQLPKYLYPSAGSLYPVQTYIYINEKSNKEIQPGIYYYHPVNHELHLAVGEENLISTNFQGSFEILFLANYSAIEPLYGDLSVPFCALEAGYMVNLINHQANLLGQKLNIINPTFNSNEILSLIESDSSNHVLCTLSNSVNEIKEIHLDETLLVLIFVKSGRLHNFKEGWYVYNVTTSQIEYYQDGDPFGLSLTSEENYAIYQTAAAAIFFLEPSCGKLISDKKELLINAGYCCQEIITQFLSHSIGVCPIGILDRKSAKILSKIAPQHAFVHALFVGPINESQIESKVQSQAPINVFEDVIREHLSKSLPQYMIPKKIISLPTFPLTKNGKIDKNALPQVEYDIQRKSILSPVNEVESFFSHIWSQILNTPIEQISTDDVFFEVGGNSLGLVQVFNEAKVKYPNLTIDKLFLYNSIKTISSFLTQESPATLNIEKIANQKSKSRENRLMIKNKMQNRERR